VTCFFYVLLLFLFLWICWVVHVFTSFYAGVLIASINGFCVAEIRDLPYDGNMWAAVCLRSPNQKVCAHKVWNHFHFWYSHASAAL
jgi:hypothetical protein